MGMSLSMTIPEELIQEHERVSYEVHKESSKWLSFEETMDQCLARWIPQAKEESYAYLVIEIFPMLLKRVCYPCWSEIGVAELEVRIHLEYILSRGSIPPVFPSGVPERLVEIVKIS